jgi:hypothetical protein
VIIESDVVLGLRGSGLDMVTGLDLATENNIKITTEKRGSVVPLQTSDDHLKFDAKLS